MDLLVECVGLHYLFAILQLKKTLCPRLMSWTRRSNKRKLVVLINLVRIYPPPLPFSLMMNWYSARHVKCVFNGTEMPLFDDATTQLGHMDLKGQLNMMPL